MSRLLEQTVRDELAIAAGVDGVDLSDETLDHFAWAVLTQLDYGFRFQWDPRWVPTGEPHLWAEGEQHYARCVTCLIVSPPTESEEATRVWYRRHRQAAHGQ